MNKENQESGNNRASIAREQKEMMIKTRGGSNSINRRMDEESKLAPLSPVSIRSKQSSMIGGSTAGRILKPVVPPKMGRDGS